MEVQDEEQQIEPEIQQEYHIGEEVDDREIKISKPIRLEATLPMPSVFVALAKSKRCPFDGTYMMKEVCDLCNYVKSVQKNYSIKYQYSTSVDVISHYTKKTY